MSSHAYDIFINDPMRFSSPSGVNNTTRLCFRHAQFDPALFLVERLVGDNREPEFIRVKIQGPVLIGHRNTDEFDLLDHDAANVIPPLRSRPDANRHSNQKLLSVYLYSYGQAARKKWKPVAASLRMLAEATGLSKSAVQIDLANLRRRELIVTTRDHATATSRHR